MAECCCGFKSSRSVSMSWNLATMTFPESTRASFTSATNGDARGREERFSKHSLARSKIKRGGLKAGTPAPRFSLPRLDGRGESAITQWRGSRVLLVFSSPNCRPCNALAPELEKFHRHHPEIEGVMIS